MKPLEKVPEIKVKTLQGKEWVLSRQKPRHFTMIVFYRGHHCPVCRHYIHELSVQLPEFEKRGVEVIAVSSSSKEKATQSQNEWHTQDLLIGYDYPVDEARKLGLFISKAVKENEPAFFFEPALLLISRDGTLYSIALQSIPFARPHFKDVIASLDYILRENYPPRGEVWERDRQALPVEKNGTERIFSCLNTEDMEIEGKWTKDSEGYMAFDSSRLQRYYELITEEYYQVYNRYLDEFDDEEVAHTSARQDGYEMLTDYKIINGAREFATTYITPSYILDVWYAFDTERNKRIYEKGSIKLSSK